MDLIDSTGSSQLQDTALPWREISKKRKYIHSRAIIDQESILQTAIGDGNGIEGQLFHECIKNCGSRYDDICTPGIYTRNFPALLKRDRTEQIDDFTQIFELRTASPEFSST